MKIALVTYVFPAVTRYLPQFVASVNEQDLSDFTAVVFNDGIDKPERYFSSLRVPTIFVPVTGSVMEIRLMSFERLAAMDFDAIVFQDADDQMSSNRVRSVSLLLDRHDMVVNDLSLSDSAGNLTARKIWEERLGNNFNFTANFIRDKNIVGLGNTAIRAHVLRTGIRMSQKPLVQDWFIFYQLMVNAKLTGLFTTTCQTIYRQHEGNIAGIRYVDHDRLVRCLEVKRAHYAALNDIGLDLTDERTALEAATQLVATKTFATTNTLKLFWWEETNLLYEKDQDREQGSL